MGQGVFGAVAEIIFPLAGDQLSSHQVVEIGLESDSPQSNDDAQIFQSFKFAFQKGSAVGQFGGQRLVAGRRTAGGGGYIKIVKNKPVVRIGRRRLTSEPGFVQDRIHEVAGGVSGERAARAIGTVGAGSQSQSEDASTGIAEAGNGLAPVIAVAVSATLLAGNLLAIRDQTRTARAGDDLGIQHPEPISRRLLPRLQYSAEWPRLGT